MPFFRKKPIVIEARQFTIKVAADVKKWEELADWCKGLIRGTKLKPEDRAIQINTLEGDMQASVGDWIIKGVKGEFYPCKPDILEATYEEVHNVQ
jgi:hypothetical protein